LIIKMSSHYFGASVRGPLHQAEDLPNQDAWLGGEHPFGTFVVVCDGMGSRTNARQGARMACRAVRQALRLWSQAEQASLDMLPRLIMPLWKLAISPVPAEDCATTCLFALLTSEGRLVCGGLGDGLIALKADDDTQVILGERGGFGNETLALGCPHRLDDWVLHDVNVGIKPVDILLATDGVADDLKPEKLSGFMDWLGHEFKPLAPVQRWRKVAHELKNWPTPKHLDDKTLALLWQEQKND
jgi:hypothetical protein